MATTVTENVTLASRNNNCFSSSSACLSSSAVTSKTLGNLSLGQQKSSSLSSASSCSLPEEKIMVADPAEDRAEDEVIRIKVRKRCRLF
jgi:hypothetical protein